MSNNLRNIEKNLRAFIKRCKEITYTKGLLFTFLMTGSFSQVNGKAKKDEATGNQKKQIENSIGDMKKLFKDARYENNKLLKSSNLELIQLMEQGDHVVKSPWSSWQYGINGFFSHWGGTYRGRGDKSERYPYNGIYERSTYSFDRYTSPSSDSYSFLQKSSNVKSATTTGREGYGSNYGLTSTTKKQEPVVSLNVEAAIKPKEVSKASVAAPNINIVAPVLVSPAIPTVIPETLTIPTPNPPVVQVNLPQPSAKPFVDFSFQNGTLGLITPTSYDEDVRYTPSSSRITNGEGHTFWTGYNTNGLVNASGVDNTTLPNGYTKENIGRRVTNRTGALLYFNSGHRLGAKPAPQNKFQAQNFDLYLAGNIGNAGTTDGGHEGALGIHTVWNGKLSNVKAHLYGKAAFLSLETWWAGKMEFDNTPGKEVKVNIESVPGVAGSGNENTIFLIYPGSYGIVATQNNGARHQRGGFTGKVNADIKTDKNIVYSVLGNQGSYEIDSSGKYNITGNENIVYSGYGYVPNWNNFVCR